MRAPGLLRSGAGPRLSALSYKGIVLRSDIRNLLGHVRRVRDGTVLRLRRRIE